MTHEEQLVNNITLKISNYVKAEDLIIVKDIIIGEVQQYVASKESTDIVVYNQSNEFMMEQFLATKSLEGRTEKTIDRYKFFIVKLIEFYPNKSFKDMTANDLRYFLSVYKNRGNNSDTTMDGIRRIYCSFLIGLMMRNISRKVQQRNYPESNMILKRNFLIQMARLKV